eukprot:COSAG02_NODE_7282_length_3086_cov_1.178775_1_plen_194_part_00
MPNREDDVREDHPSQSCTTVHTSIHALAGVVRSLSGRRSARFERKIGLGLAPMRTSLRTCMSAPTMGMSLRTMLHPSLPHGQLAAKRWSHPQQCCDCWRRLSSSRPPTSPPPFQLAPGPGPTATTAPHAAAAAAKWRKIDSAAATLTVRAHTRTRVYAYSIYTCLPTLMLAFLTTEVAVLADGLRGVLTGRGD